jgi:hypothetical protein
MEALPKVKRIDTLCILTFVGIIDIIKTSLTTILLHNILRSIINRKYIFGM